MAWSTIAIIILSLLLWLALAVIAVLFLTLFAAVRKMEKDNPSQFPNMAPRPKYNAHHWTRIMNLSPSATEEEVRIKYRRMAKHIGAHSDSESLIKRLNIARDEAMTDIRRRMF